MAKDIVTKTQQQLEYWRTMPYKRMEALKQMEAELLQLKKTYAGLVDLPKEEFASYSDAEEVYFKMKSIRG